MRRAIVLAALVACGGSKETPPESRVGLPDTIAPASPAPTFAFEVPPPAEKIIDLGRGESHACVLRASGSVDCWGRFGRSPPTPTPRRMLGAGDAVAMSDDAECVIRRDGSSACFATDRLELVPVGDEPIADFGAGSLCRIMRDRSLRCGSETVPGAANIAAVAGRDRHVCAIDKDGKVACTAGALHEPLIPVVGLTQPVTLIGHEPGAEDGMTCVVYADGTPDCFALVEREKPPQLVVERAAFGKRVTNLEMKQLAGVTALVQSSTTLEAIVGGKVVHWDATGGTRILPDLVDAVKLVEGCALRAQGSVVCWGSNLGGVLGQPTTIGRVHQPPAQVVGAANVAMIALGDADTWAVTRDNTLLHWGSTAEGWATPVALPKEVGTITAVAAGAGAACVLNERQESWCQLPKSRGFVKHANKVISISFARRNLYELKADHTVETSEVGEKIDSYDTFRPVKTAPPDAVSIVTKGYHVCALTKSGDAHCWDDKRGWEKVPMVAKASQIAQAYTPCALTPSTVTCWRQHYETGAFEAKPGPPWKHVTSIASDDDILCGVHANGRVSCRTHYGDPYDVIVTGAVSVELGQVGLEYERFAERGAPYGCALMKDRSVKCWGVSANGVLGDGSLRRSERPLGVPGL